MEVLAGARKGERCGADCGARHDQAAACPANPSLARGKGAPLPRPASWHALPQAPRFSLQSLPSSPSPHPAALSTCSCGPATSPSPWGACRCSSGASRHPTPPLHAPGHRRCYALPPPATGGCVCVCGGVCVWGGGGGGSKERPSGRSIRAATSSVLPTSSCTPPPPPPLCCSHVTIGVKLGQGRCSAKAWTYDAAFGGEPRCELY